MNPALYGVWFSGIACQSQQIRVIVLSKRTNYKQEKRRKEIDKQKRKEAKKERKTIKEKSDGSHEEISSNEEERAIISPCEVSAKTRPSKMVSSHPQPSMYFA